MTDEQETRTRTVVQLRRWQQLLRHRLRVIEGFNRDAPQRAENGTRLVLSIGEGAQAKRVEWPADCEHLYVLLARAGKIIEQVEAAEPLCPAELERLERETADMLHQAGIEE